MKKKNVPTDPNCHINYATWWCHTHQRPLSEKGACCRRFIKFDPFAQLFDKNAQEPRSHWILHVKRAGLLVDHFLDAPTLFDMERQVMDLKKRYKRVELGHLSYTEVTTLSALYVNAYFHNPPRRSPRVPAGLAKVAGRHRTVTRSHV